MEEALGYEELVNKHKYTIQQLADKVHKSKSYIAARLKLCALEKEARAAFFDEKLTAKTALLIARIPVKSLQTQAVKEILAPRHRNEAMSAREATEHIQRSYMLRLKEAPFKTTDESLHKKAGACTTCPKRTGNQPELFSDVDSADVCTDPQCFGQKREAWATIRIAEAKAKGQKVIEGTPAQKIFPYQHGNHTGPGFHELNDKNYSDPKQRTFKQLAKQAGVEPILVKNPHNGMVVELITDDGANPANEAENERVRKAKVETQFRQRLFSEIRAKATGQMQNEDWIEIALRMLARIDSNDFKRLLTIYGWEKDMNAFTDRTGRLRKKLEGMTTNELNDVMRDCALIGEVHAGGYSTGKPERLLSAAARYGVDVNTIKNEMKAAAAAKKKPAAEKKPVAKKVTAKTALIDEPAKKRVATRKPAAKPAEPQGKPPTRVATLEEWPFPTGARP
jgi:hypothetical protein